MRDDEDKSTLSGDPIHDLMPSPAANEREQQNTENQDGPFVDGVSLSAVTQRSLSHNPEMNLPVLLAETSNDPDEERCDAHAEVRQALSPRGRTGMRSWRSTTGSRRGSRRCDSCGPRLEATGVHPRQPGEWGPRLSGPHRWAANTYSHPSQNHHWQRTPKVRCGTTGRRHRKERVGYRSHVRRLTCSTLDL